MTTEGKVYLSNISNHEYVVDVIEACVNLK